MTTPTAEQQAAIDTYGDGLDMVIQAGAGCGKSSTLKMLSRTDPRARMAYIAYNKSIATEAGREFPSHVACSTAHSLAFRAVGQQYAARLGGPRQTAYDAATILGVHGVTQLPTDDGRQVAITSAKAVRLALETVTRWCYSADPEIEPRHVPQVTLLRTPIVRQMLTDLVVPIARKAWADLESPGGRLKFAHDHYVKIWALGAPMLPFDTVLLDEGQDTNDVITSLLLAQDHAQRICVGDSAQQIYEWRGARDALATFTRALDAQELTLSQSFRFGPAIADAANAWLNLIAAPLRLTGWEQADSEIVPHLPDPDAILCRTNAGAMGAVMELLAGGRRVALVGGGGDMQRLARAAKRLLMGQDTDHPELATFASWQQVREYVAEEPDGADLRVLVDLIDDHGPDAILAATERLVTESAAEVTVSTAHRSKGREWPRVRIHTDFRPPGRDQKTGLTVLRREEARLAYVAVTRARQQLDHSALAWVDQVTAVSD